MVIPKTKISILVMLAVLVLISRFFWFPVRTAIGVVVVLGYWIMMAGAIVYAFHLWGLAKRKCSIAFFRAHRLGLLISLLGVMFLELHEPRQFKVLYDEYTISGVARNLHFSREATYPVAAHNINDRLEIFGATMDKRPLFFQFILSCVHDLTGYRPGNVFILNGVVAFFLLFLTYYFGTQYGGQFLGITCVLLWIGLPLLAQCVTSGGYDAFNLLMIMLFWYFGREYYREGGIHVQSLFVLTSVHLAQVRYESILFIVPMAAVLLLRWIKQRNIELGWVAVISPLFLLLPLLINLVFTRTPGFTQTSPDQDFFSIHYFVENVERAIWYLFSLDSSMTNSVVLSLLGAISLVAFLVKTISMRRVLLLDGDHVVLLLLGIVVLVNLSLVMSNFWGQLDDQAASRFSLPLHLLFICCFAWFVHEWRRRKPMPVWLIVPLLFSIVFAASSSAQHTATRRLWVGRECSWFIEQIGVPEHRNALIIAHPVGPILYNHPTVGIEVAEANKWKIKECLKNRIYPEILVLEKWSVDYRTGEERPYSDDKSLDLKKDVLVGENCTALGSSFKKETIAEFRLRPNVVSRISRVLAVEGVDAVPPTSYKNETFPFKNIQSYTSHIYSMLPQ